MQKLIFRNGNGKEINLTSGDYGITEWEGFSANELNIQSQQVPFQDGAVFLDALLEQRILSVTVAMNAKNDLEKRYRLRREMISTLNPKLGEGLLIYTNDFLSKQIHVIPQLPVFENNNSNDSGTPKVSCSFVACNPYWEDIEETEIYLNLGETPIVINDGDIPVQVKVDFFATNVNNPAITNLTNDKFLKYNGQLNTNLLIDTEIGNKQVLTEELGLKKSALGGYFSGIAYSEGKRKWVVVNSEGNLLTGRNLQNLNLITVDVVRYNLYSVVYSDELELFVAVGVFPDFSDSGGLIITSPDGEIWTERLTSLTHNLFFVTYIKELHKFFATGDECVYTSIDGENWSSSSSSIGYDANLSLAYSSDLEKFVMTSSNGFYTSDDDGESWTKTYDTDYGVNSVIYSKRLNEFIAVGNNNYVYTSLDGTNWESTIAASGMSRNLECVVEKNNVLIAVGSTGIVLKSYNGTDWNIIEIAEIADEDCWIEFATYIEQYGMFVICGRSAFIATSENGDKWEVVSFESVPYLYDVIYVEEKNKYYGVSYSEKIYSSPDGENWALAWEPSEVKITNLYSITYSKSKGIFVACGEGGIVVISADGESWARRAIQPAVDFNSVIYVDELEIFVMVGDEGTIMTSTNGSQWSQKNTPGLGDLKDVAYSGILGKFVIVASFALIFENSDFTEYFHMTLRDVELNSVAYNNKTGLFVVVGLYVLPGKEGISVFSMVSTDTENWESFADNNFPLIFGKVYLTYVCFSENYNAYIATSPNGKIFISDNGLDWKMQNIGCNDNLQKIRYISENKTNVILSNNGGYFTLGLKSGVNAIQNIDSKSDMNFNLEVGDNTLQLTKDSGNFSAKITYRQKYLGV